MNKWYLLIVFLFSLCFNVRGEHPLSSTDDVASIYDKGSGLDIFFLPMNKVDASMVGLAVGKLYEEGKGFLYIYCAVEKQNGISDVYLLSQSSEQTPLFMLIEIKKTSDNSARVHIKGEKEPFTAEWDTMTKEKTSGLYKETISDYKADHSNWKEQVKLAKNVIYEYTQNGRSGVRAKYGKTIYEEVIDEKDTKQDSKKKEKKNKQSSKTESSTPKVDKNGCIAYVEKTNLAKVVSKKVVYKDGRIYWTCKVKNISSKPISSCYVSLKCYDADEIEIVDDISSVRNIPAGETRIISGSTISVKESDYHAIKRKEFTVSPSVD